VAVTRSGAEVLGTEADVGTLQKGKFADILVVDGNPLDRISDVRNVRLVLKGGEVIFSDLAHQSTHEPSAAIGVRTG
jgi:imidazolonepropionase-like amidohydrolase